MRALYARRPDWAATQPELGSISWPDEDRRVLAYRIAALDHDPSSAPFLLHVVLDEDGRLLGRIGCHAGPDQAGEVEIGYFVQPSERGRGIAGRTVDEFLIWLQSNGVSRLRATARPDNEASIKILKRRGFVEVGSQIDAEDGLELVYQRPLGG
jgi:[ribosomal protein S5]-alanine N-acetyltransferase